MLIKNLASALFIGLLLLSPLSSQAEPAEDFKPSSPVTAVMPVVMDNLDILKLTPAQMDQVRQIARQNFSQVEFINAQYNDLKTQLKEETLDPAGDKKLALKLIQELANLDKQRMTLTIECVFGLKSILTPQQYQEVMDALAM